MAQHQQRQRLQQQPQVLQVQQKPQLFLNNNMGVQNQQRWGWAPQPMHSMVGAGMPAQAQYYAHAYPRGRGPSYGAGPVQAYYNNNSAGANHAMPQQPFGGPYFSPPARRQQQFLN